MINNIIKNVRKNKNVKINLVVYILFFLSILIYFISLCGCSYSFHECTTSRKIKKYFYLGFLLILSCIVFALSFFIQVISSSKTINYLIFFAIYSIIFLFTQGTDFAHHGTYNSIIFIIFFPIIFIHIFFILFIYKIFL